LDNLSLIFFNAAFYITLISIILSFIRFLMGPSPADRVVALDAMTICGIVLIIFIALKMGRIIYLDVAMVYGLLSFLGVLAIARYLEGGL
jgi:multicomponent Na+:H+ antiporter subunit F